MFAAPGPAAPPVNPPVTTGTGQLYVVPAGITPSVPFTGVTEKPAPPQMVAASPPTVVTTGTGLTITDLVIGVPGQAVAPGPVGVIV